MSLPTPWIDKIFQRFMLTYGDHFLAAYRSMPIVEVKSLWSEKLAGFVDNPDAIAFALANLPSERAPNVLQFRDICRQAPAPNRLQLPAPEEDPEKVAAELRKLKDAARKTFHGDKSAKKQVDCLAWAKRLKARHDGGEKLGMYQIACYRRALGLDEQEAA